MPFYDNFINGQDATQRQWATCIFDDVLEFCGQQSWNYNSHIMQPLINGLRDPNAANRQAAAYGVGIAAQKGGDQWSDFVAASIDTLFQVTQFNNARGEDEVFATENACAAIAKILHFNNTKVQNAQSVVERWIDTLPITNDEEAAPYAYSFLCELIDTWVFLPTLLSLLPDAVLTLLLQKQPSHPISCRAGVPEHRSGS
jgi:importin-5